MLTKRTILLGSALAFATTLSATSMAMADGGGGGDWHETVVYEFELVSGGTVNPAAVTADLDCVAGMREHHAGALAMSQEYLAKGRNPVLRRMAGAIVANQEYQIAVLDEVKRHVEQAALVMIPGPGSPSPLALRATAPRAAKGLTGLSGPGAGALHGDDGAACPLPHLTWRARASPANIQP